MSAQKLRRFCAPGFPFNPLGILHSCFDETTRRHSVRAFDGSKIETQLTYTAYLALCGTAPQPSGA